MFNSTGASVSQFDFSRVPSLGIGVDSADLSPSILCVCPFNRVNALVGLESGDGNGMLYLVNVVLGKILRAFVLPLGVSTSLRTFNVRSIIYSDHEIVLDYVSYNH